MKCNFYVGQKVVCIDDGWHALNGEITPKKDVVYTIRSIQGGIKNVDSIYLRVVEIVNLPRTYSDGFTEVQFNVEAFRPVQERSTETGMAILRGLLSPTKEKVS